MGMGTGREGELKAEIVRKWHHSLSLYPNYPKKQKTLIRNTQFVSWYSLE